MVAKIYAMTLTRLKQTNKRLWFKFTYGLAEIYVASAAFDKVRDLMTELWEYTKRPDGTEDPAKAAYVFQMLALNIEYLQQCGPFH